MNKMASWFFSCVAVFYSLCIFAITLSAYAPYSISMFIIYTFECDFLVRSLLSCLLCHIFSYLQPPFLSISCSPDLLLEPRFPGRILFILYIYLFIFCLFAFSRATPVAYGGSQARGQIGAVADGLHHSHSHVGSEPRLGPTPQLTATPDP